VNSPLNTLIAHEIDLGFDLRIHFHEQHFLVMQLPEQRLPVMLLPGLEIATFVVLAHLKVPIGDAVKEDELADLGREAEEVVGFRGSKSRELRLWRLWGVWFAGTGLEEGGFPIGSVFVPSEGLGWSFCHGCCW
jgi:hypothetical protein